MSARDKLGPYALEFYRGEHCNFMPKSDVIVADDPTTEEHILYGWTPDKPFITKEHKVLAFGSCFADEVQNYLRKRQYNIPPIDKCSVTKCGAGMVNTYTIRQQFEWAYDESSSENPDDVWHFDPAIPPAWQLKKDKQITRELFDTTDVFIITLGLSEVWYEKATGYVFWKAISSEIFDEEKHGFRVTTVEENKQNLSRIIELIKKYNPKATIVLTVSPVGLKATFRPVSCITANCVSKSVLRVAIDELIRDGNQSNVFYWPSYEIITASHTHQFEADHRHPKRESVERIMRLFHKYFLTE